MTELNRTRYTHRDYESLKSDLVKAIPSLTQEWTSREDADPGIVLIKLMAMLGDNLSYNMDKMALELYLDSVTQRKNCAKVLSLLGYKMHWYRSGKLRARVRLSNDAASAGVREVLTPFETVFRTPDGQKTYTVINEEFSTTPYDIYSGDFDTDVDLIEGYIHTVTFTKDNLVNNRYYLPYDNIDESHFWLYLPNRPTPSGILTDNLYLATDDSNLYFEFNVDEYDKPYIELVSYWESLVAGNCFTLRFIITSGSRGDVSANTLVGSRNLMIRHEANTSNFKEYDSADPSTWEMVVDYNSSGYDPETVEDARKSALNYVFTHDTLVTVSDFEKASLRSTSISVSKLVDQEVIENDRLQLYKTNYDHLELTGNLSESIVGREEIAGFPEFSLVTTTVNGLEDNRSRALIDNPYYEPDKDESYKNPKYYLKPYVAIMYIAQGNFDLEYNSYSHQSGLVYKDYDNLPKIKTDSGGEEVSDYRYFPYKPTNNILTLASDIYNDCKIANVSVTFGTLKIYPFRVAGTVHFIEPMSPQDTLSLVNMIDSTLADHFHPRNQGFGKKPQFIEIVDTIHATDNRVHYFDAEGSIVEYVAGLDLKGFDTTSCVKYNGLSDNFTVDPKFMSFDIKNWSSQDISHRVSPEDSSKPKWIFKAGSKTTTIVCSSVEELKELVDLLGSNSYLTYSERS